MNKSINRVHQISKVANRKQINEEITIFEVV